ncbi:hypothetical protein LXA43DRAFT_1077244 [Ganoderma leucocontextum]|nr:hypothetical protein LXA43DRAFT_1077244 [Ganoderma leucocontextum]
MISRTLSLFLLALLGFVNIWIDYSFVEDVRKVLEKRPPPLSHYTWVEDDVPERFPLISPRPHVRMSIEESVRYSIRAPEAPLEWLWTATANDMGNTHLGPTHRIGVVALAHQQHCIRSLRAALDAGDVPTEHALHHAEHCLSFLRESTLCAADTTLEPGDAFSRNFTAERVTGDRECMDAEAFYASMLQRWNDWVEVRDQTRKTT